MSHVEAGPPLTFGELALRHRLTLVVAGAVWGKSAMLRGLTTAAPSIQVRRPSSGWSPFALAHGLVGAFVANAGTPLDESRVRKNFALTLEAAGLPNFRVYDLRHTCAMLLLVRNISLKIVSEVLGHATIAITLDTYSHVLPNMQDSATRALEDALR